MGVLPHLHSIERNSVAVLSKWGLSTGLCSGTFICYTRVKVQKNWYEQVFLSKVNGFNRL